MQQDVQQLLKDYKDETQRHFDVVMEKVRGDVGVIGEQYESIIGRLDKHNQRLEGIEDSLQTIKIDIEFIKNDLKKKVDRDEFVALERRVSLMEARSAHAS